ncbi:MAG: flagellar hook-length control protein FliK [Limisphaerales bacterium]|nr:MAG: flagellar hook-length control protein FliK [Limisphaerales bacterium]KAG0507093.1 MAG: flagellar hook-length control protein FliK [Limisphaerales bacterium]TXT49297.1 MAG: flagellar hook-length control protein FliK [Limisphaerales bacterium]
MRRAQQLDEAKPPAPDVSVVLGKHLDESALATLDAPKKAVAKVSPGEARGPEGRAERAPSPLAGEPAAEAGAFTTQPAIADRENHFLPVRPVRSAAEARFAPPPPSDSAAPAAAPLPFRAGTGTAELGDGMKNATEPKQIAGPAQQNLPEPGVTSHAMVTEWLRRGGVRSLPAAAATEARPEGAAPLISLWSPDQSKVRAAEEVIAQPAAVAPGSPSPMEPLQSNVLKHITELRHTGATEMAVVLRPDAATQLSLRLSLGSDGEVTVQARCEQGDAQLLAANWGEIRHSLAQQGVRLGALEFAPDRHPDPFQPHAGNGGPSPDGQPSSQRHGQPWPETLDDLPLTGSLTEPLTRRGVPRPPAGRTRLLESWA